MTYAEQLANDSGKPAVIYHRPADDGWFVLPADADAPPGPTIRATIRPDDHKPDRPDFPEHPLDGPSPTDLRTKRG